MDADRRDLAAMLHPLVESLIAMELPILAEHGISMWAYSVLSVLDDSPIRTQAALATAIGADKTRIISTLDALQAAGHITREPDPQDRRVPPAGDHRTGPESPPVRPSAHPGRRGPAVVRPDDGRPPGIYARRAAIIEPVTLTAELPFPSA